ncbi:MAG TPA: MMPL family transporter, partial [Acidimicrobiia bacterium]|nr:MMPL family transporter [Acidimicrobiia bacterium]
LGLDPASARSLLQALSSPAGLRLDARLLAASPALRSKVGFFLSPDGRTTRLVLALRGNPFDRSTFTVVRRIERQAATALSGSSLAGSRIIVGGPGAFLVDFQDASNGDFRAVAALVLAAALVVLTILLRSPVAPLYLLPTAVLSFTAALGLTAVVFQGILHQSGLSFWLPVWLFTILVALGADYNIFLTGRIREELDAGATPAEAVRNGLVLTGPVITSAGLILAGTFAAALLSPLPFLQQSGFAIATGVLIDTFVVRTLLVPAVAVLLGRYAFWPSGTPDPAPSTRSRSVVLAGAGIATLTAGLLLVAATRPSPDPFHRVATTPSSAQPSRP